MGAWFAVTNLDPSEVQRRKADGTLDTTFTPGQASGAGQGTPGCVSTGINLCTGIDFVMSAPDATGDIYVAGGFTTYNSAAVGHIVRINRDGTLE